MLTPKLPLIPGFFLQFYAPLLIGLSFLNAYREWLYGLLIFLLIEHGCAYLFNDSFGLSFPHFKLIHYGLIFILGLSLLGYLLIYEKKEAAWSALLSSLLPLNLSLIVWIILMASAAHHMRAYDAVLLHMDILAFGFSPSFYLGNWLAHRAYEFPYIVIMSYNLLALYTTLIPIYDIWHHKSFPLNYYFQLMIIVMIGVSTYWLIPACGLKVFFGTNWPLHFDSIKNLSECGRHAAPVFNCMPSVHMALAFLIFLHTLKRGITMTALGFLIVFLTLISTLGLGEHYFIDLIMGMLLTLGIYSICLPGLTLRELIILMFNLILFALWLFLFRLDYHLFFKDHGILSQAFYGLSLFCIVGSTWKIWVYHHYQNHIESLFRVNGTQCTQ